MLLAWMECDKRVEREEGRYMELSGETISLPLMLANMTSLRETSHLVRDLPIYHTNWLEKYEAEGVRLLIFAKPSDI